MKDQITLYSAVTIPYPLPRVPSKAFEKLVHLQVAGESHPAGLYYCDGNKALMKAVTIPFPQSRHT
jgi:hypothetical protein